MTMIHDDLDVFMCGMMLMLMLMLIDVMSETK